MNCNKNIQLLQLEEIRRVKEENKVTEVIEERRLKQYGRGKKMGEKRLSKKIIKWRPHSRRKQRKRGQINIEEWGLENEGLRDNEAWRKHALYI